MTKLKVLNGHTFDTLRHAELFSDANKKITEYQILKVLQKQHESILVLGSFYSIMSQNCKAMRILIRMVTL